MTDNKTKTAETSWVMVVTDWQNRDKHTDEGLLIEMGRALMMETDGRFPAELLTHRIVGKRVRVTLLDD